MVELKKKVTLREKHGNSSVPSQPPTPPSSNWWKWLIAILVILVIAGGIYWYSNKSKTSEPIPTNLVTDSTKTDSAYVAQTDTTKAQKENSANAQNSKDKGTTVSNANSGTNKDQVANNKPSVNTSSPTVENDETNGDMSVDNIEAKAKQVIRGDFGNGVVRKQKLGSEYASIQSKVNEMYRTGIVR